MIPVQVLPDGRDESRPGRDVIVWRPLDSGHPSWIAVPAEAWDAFVAAVKAGEYDLPDS